MKIDRKKLFELYMAKVDEIANDPELDWKTQFGPKEIVDMIAGIIEKNPKIIETDLDLLARETLVFLDKLK